MRKTLTLFFLLFALKLTSQSFSKSEIDTLKTTLYQMMIDDQIYRSVIRFGTMDSNELATMQLWNSKKQIQRFLSVNKNEIGISKQVKDSLWVLQNRNDSLNLFLLISIIEKYGFPNEKSLGNDKVQFSWGGKIPAKNIGSLIVIHLCSPSEFNILFPIFNSELKKGNMLPINFAEWYDRCMLFQNKKVLYGEYGRICVENLETTNLERLKIGLKILQKNNCPSNI